MTLMSCLSSGLDSCYGLDSNIVKSEANRTYKTKHNLLEKAVLVAVAYGLAASKMQTSLSVMITAGNCLLLE